MYFILMDVAHAMVYIDDIIIFSKDFDEHLADIETVFKRLKLAITLFKEKFSPYA